MSCPSLTPIHYTIQECSFIQQNGPFTVVWQLRRTNARVSLQLYCERRSIVSSRLFRDCHLHDQTTILQTRSQYQVQVFQSHCQSLLITHHERIIETGSIASAQAVVAIKRALQFRGPPVFPLEMNAMSESGHLPRKHSMPFTVTHLSITILLGFHSLIEPRLTSYR